MAEPKAKPVTKKASSTQAGSATAVKAKSAKVTATVAARKATPKSTTPTVKKTATTATSKKIPVRKAAPAKKPTAKLTPEQRYLMVQTAAYFIAERNGFGGRATEHWAAAEIEIASKLS